jgi:dynein light intermediate chain 1
LAWTTAEDDQAFLAKQLDILLKDPQRDPRATFRTAAAVSHNQDGAAGVVGPMAGTGLSLPSVELAMKEMEGASTDDLKERFARLSRRVS